MTLHVCLLGTDGSGKTTLAAPLSVVLAAEMRFCVGSAGEAFTVVGPDEDLLAPNFHPDGFPLSARVSEWFKGLAKKAANNRTIYPAFKLAHMALQDRAARKLADRYKVDVMVSEGNTLLSAMGRAANYSCPASDPASPIRPAPDVKDLDAVFAHLIDGQPLPERVRAKAPVLGWASLIGRLCRFAGFDPGWLPDAVIFLDVSPETALLRITSRHGKIDRHENVADLAQARSMYVKTLEAYRRCRGSAKVLHIAAQNLAPGETLRAAIEGLRPWTAAGRRRSLSSSPVLGTTNAQLAGSGFWKRVLDRRYLFRHLLPMWFRGAWREPMFVFSKAGRLLLNEGYSARVMRVIYEREKSARGFWDRIFVGYPLHRAVYDRLQILRRRIQPELESRLRGGRSIRVFTAPSGFADDLFQPLESMASGAASLVHGVDVTAVDLDPQGTVAEETARRAAKLGFRFRFVRADLTSEDVRVGFEKDGPYDIALFVGLSSWLPKPETLSHLRWLREHLREDGLLVTDCFTAGAYALAGCYAGYKAQYYSPGSYRMLLDYCGFDGLGAMVESGADRINHVLIASPRPLNGRARCAPG